MPVLPPARQLNRFFLLSWLIAVVQVAGLQGARQFTEAAVAGWTLAATISYAFIYLLPALLLAHLLRRLLAYRSMRSAPAVLAAAAVGLTGLTQVLLFADRLIHDMYGFHINGFVIDLVLTPGGIAALGAGPSTRIAAGLIVLALFAAQAGAYAWVMRHDGAGRWAANIRWRWK